MKGWIVGLAAVTVLSWAPVDAKAGIVFDDFNDGNADGWTFREFDPRGPGEWSVVNQVLVNNASTDWNMGLADNLFLSDQVVETQLKTAGYAGVTLWFHDENNWVSAFINPFSTGLQIQKMVDGNSTGLLYVQRTWADTWYDFRVEADSQTGELAIYLDGDLKLTYQTNSLYRSGQSGVFSGNAPAYFDDFQLSSADIAPVPEPACLAIWSMLGLAGFGAAWRRKRCSRG